MDKKRKPNPITYCKNKDIRLRFPSFRDYLDPNWSSQDAENFLNQQRHQAHLWINNQLEAFEIETYALDNDKRIIEADYAIYLVLRSAQKRASNEIIDRFAADANDALTMIQKKKTSRKNLNTQVSRTTKRRSKLKDYGNLGDQ